jgi:hypothetical protein
MKQRTLAILGAAAVLSIGTALVLSPGNPEAPAGADKLAFEGLASRLGGATRIEIDKHDGKLVLERKGDTWVAAERGGYPVRVERVRELLVGLTEVRLLEPRTADPSLHERLGVEDPSKPGSTGLLVRVQEANGTPMAELVVGRRRVRTQGNLPESAYIRRPGEAQSWLAEGRLPVDADPQLWLDRDVVNLPATRVREVAVRRTDEPELVLVRAGQATEGSAKLALSAPPGFQATDESAVDEVARALEFVTFLEVKPEGDAPGAALGESRFALVDGPAVVVAAFRDGDTLWLRLRAEGEGAAAQTEAERLNARWRGWAYQVAAWKEKAVLPRLSDLGGRASTSDSTPASPASPSPAPSHAAAPSATSQPATAAQAAPAGASTPSPATSGQRPAAPAVTATPAAPPATSEQKAAPAVAATPAAPPATSEQRPAPAVAATPAAPPSASEQRPATPAVAATPTAPPAASEQRPAAPAVVAAPAVPPAASEQRPATPAVVAAPAASPNAAPAAVASPAAPAAENGAAAASPSSPASNQAAAPASSAAQTAAPAATGPNTTSGQASIATPGITPSGSPAAAVPGEQTATTAPNPPAPPSAPASSSQAAASPTAALPAVATPPAPTTPSPSPSAASAPASTPSASPAMTDTAPPAPQALPAPTPPTTTAQTTKGERSERLPNRNRGSASRDQPPQPSAAQSR